MLQAHHFISHVRHHGAAYRGSSAGSDLARPSRKDMVSDIVAVVLWAASIPALMWLGAAAGF